MFIRAIAAVVVTVTQPLLGNTPVVVAGKTVSCACGGDTGGTVHFIRTITAVVNTIAVPALQDAVFVVARECIR